MFGNALEVAKFEGGYVERERERETTYHAANQQIFTRERYASRLIRTVSGIRGQIKKALPAPAPDGAFRATFEDKIVKSDIVFLRAWVPVEPVKFYNPVTTLLQASKSDFVGMKTVFQLRKEQQLAIPVDPDRPAVRGRGMRPSPI